MGHVPRKKSAILKSDGREAAAMPSGSVQRVPVPLSSIIGQRRAIARLMDSMRSGRVHHAWIFYGPPGVGKFTCALSFGATLLDPGAREDRGGLFHIDQTGEVGRLLLTGSHPDLHVVNRELAKFHPDRAVRELKQTNIPLDVVREFMLTIGGIQPMISRGARTGKVFIVDEAELLATPAQNAVLKFLEEPPPRTVVILVTSSVERLLPTIRSRCQRVFFPSLDEREMKQWLDQAGVDVPPGERAWLLDFADGSPGMLQGALEFGLPTCRKAITPFLDEAAKGRYNPEFAPVMTQLVEERAETQVKANPNLSKLAANRLASDWLLRLVGWQARHLIREGKAVGVRWADAIRQAEFEVDSNVNLLFVFEKLACEMVLGKAEGVET
jgi:DNA polymerase-3 subunit delta'